MPLDQDNSLIPMTQREHDELTQLNGGNPIPDRETQQQLMDLRSKLFPAIVSGAQTQFNYDKDAAGQPSYLRNQSIPLANPRMPSDIDLLKQQQGAIQDKSDFQAKLKALQMLQGK